MSKRVIHFVFSDEDKDDQLGSFWAAIAGYAKPIWLVPNDTVAFKACLKALGNEFSITIWVHLRGQDRNEHQHYEGVRFMQQKFIPEFGLELARKVRFVTRATPQAGDRAQIVRYEQETIMLGVFNDTELDTEFRKAEFLVNVGNIAAKDDDGRNEDDALLRLPLNNKFMVDFLQGRRIDQINAYLVSVKSWLAQIATASGDKWYEALFNTMGIQDRNPFDTKYWSFPKTAVSDYFILQTNDPAYQETVSNTFGDFEKEVKYSETARQWEIHLNFFYAVSERKKSITDDFLWDGVMEQATALYLLHEALHQEHRLDFKTVAGIGNFPKTVEEADYQADAFAIILEFCRYYHNNAENELNARSLGHQIVRIIRIALETTFSFNSLGDLSGIQVRRANRYLLWFYQTGLIEKQVTDKMSPREALITILNILSIKPIVEISGPSLYVNRAKDRLLFDLNDPARHIQEIVLFHNNRIDRIGLTRELQMERLIEGLKKSSYPTLYDYFSTLFWAKVR